MRQCSIAPTSSHTRIFKQGPSNQLKEDRLLLTRRYLKQADLYQRSVTHLCQQIFAMHHSVPLKQSLADHCVPNEGCHLTAHPLVSMAKR